MSTEHSPASPAVAVGPYTRGPWKMTEDAGHPANIRVTSTARRHVAKVYALSLDRDVVAEANAALICAAPDLLAACEAMIYPLERIEGGYHVAPITATALLGELRSAIARARGLRPCDVPELVPEVLQAQPQCVHGEKVIRDGRTRTCPLHRFGPLGEQRHTNITSGGVWYTYVCYGALEEQAERTSDEQGRDGDFEDRVERLLGH